MPIVTDKVLKEVSVPFPNFQPNTLILSEQVNDNNDELQYKTNLLINAFNLFNEEASSLEEYLKQFEGRYEEFKTATGLNFADVRKVAEDNKNLLNTRITNEVSTLNGTINTKDKAIHDRVTSEVRTINTKVDGIKTTTDAEIVKLKTGKADGLELKNTLLYLKSGSTNISVADLAGLGGGVGRAGTNIAFGQSINISDWTLDATTGLYKVTLTHNLNTSSPLVTYYDSVSGFNIFDVSKITGANTVDVYNDTAIDTYISVINGSSKIELVQAILDDENITTLRTWSSDKIRKEIDGKTVDLTPIEAEIAKNKVDIAENKASIVALQKDINGSRDSLLTSSNEIVSLLGGGN